MTGFGAANEPLIIEGKTIASINVECRSVNGRFLDLTIKSPEEARAAEGAIRELVSKKLNRGKVEFRIHIHREHVPSDRPQVAQSDIEARFNHQALAELSAMAQIVQANVATARPLSVADILRWPGILLEEEIGASQLNEAILAAVAKALDALLASRQEEGNALKQVILDRVEAMQVIVQRVEPIIPQATKIYQDKLSEKLTSLLEGLDAQGRAISKEDIADRIRQEVVIYGTRIDVAEEIARLLTHFDAVRSALAKGGPVGKRLDFLMQELQRESNTLGSKSVTQETSDASMELKLLVEQIREQVQNLE